MKKRLEGVWHQGHVLCPRCLVQPGVIRRYGADGQGLWFAAECPHCAAQIRWYRQADLSRKAGAPAPGEQLSLVMSVPGGKKSVADKTLTFPETAPKGGKS